MRATPSMLCIAAASALLAVARAQTAVRDDAPALYHPFAIPARLAWGAISIDLSPHAWRVGRVDGAPATEAELRTALANLAGIEIGGRCAGWVEGRTMYPCGFEVRDLDLAGVAGDRFRGTAVDLEPPSDRAVAASRLAKPEIGAAGFIAPVLDTPRFVSVKVPPRYLGNKSDSLGSKLGFEFRVVSNSLVPSQFDRSSGTVILRAGRRATTDAVDDKRVSWRQAAMQRASLAPTLR